MFLQLPREHIEVFAQRRVGFLRGGAVRAPDEARAPFGHRAMAAQQRQRELQIGRRNGAPGELADLAAPDGCRIGGIRIDRVRFDPRKRVIEQRLLQPVITDRDRLLPCVGKGGVAPSQAIEARCRRARRLGGHAHVARRRQRIEKALPLRLGDPIGGAPRPLQCTMVARPDMLAHGPLPRQKKRAAAPARPALCTSASRRPAPTRNSSAFPLCARTA
jgi:hypothetical protein